MAADRNNLIREWHLRHPTRSFLMEIGLLERLVYPNPYLTRVRSPPSSEESLRSEYLPSPEETPSTPTLFRPQQADSSDEDDVAQHALDDAELTSAVDSSEPRRVRHIREDLLKALIATFTIVNTAIPGQGPYEIPKWVTKSHWDVPNDPRRKINAMVKTPWKDLNDSVGNILKSMRDKRVMQNRYVAAGLAVLMYFGQGIVRRHSRDGSSIYRAMSQLDKLQNLLKAYDDPFRMGTEKELLSTTSPVLLCRTAHLTLSRPDSGPLPEYNLSALPFAQPRFVLSHTNMRLLLMTFGVQPPDLILRLSLRDNQLQSFPAWKPFPFPALVSIDLSDNMDLRYLPLSFIELNSLNDVETRHTQLVAQHKETQWEVRPEYYQESADESEEEGPLNSIPVSPAANIPQTDSVVDCFGTGLGRRISWNAIEFCAAWSRRTSSRGSRAISRRVSRMPSPPPEAASPPPEEVTPETEPVPLPAAPVEDPTPEPIETKKGVKRLVDLAIAVLIKYQAQIPESEGGYITPSDSFPGTNYTPVRSPVQAFDRLPNRLYDPISLPSHLKDQMDRTFLCEMCGTPATHEIQPRDLPEAIARGNAMLFGKVSSIFAYSVPTMRGESGWLDANGVANKNLKIKAMLCERCREDLVKDD